MHVVRQHVLLVITCHPTLYVHASPGDRHCTRVLLNKQGFILQYALTYYCRHGRIIDNAVRL